MPRAVLILLVIVNLVVLGYSTHHFLFQLELSWKFWLEKDVAVIPMLLFVLGGISSSIFLLNLSFPFLVVYAFFFRQPPETSLLLLRSLTMIVLTIDIIFVVATNIKFKSLPDLFGGLLGGCLLLLMYHKLQFGDINFRAPILKVYHGMVDQLEKIFR